MEANDGGKDIMEARGGKDKEEPGLKKHEPLFKPLDRKQFRFSVGYFLVTLLILFLINFLFLRPKVESIDYSAFKAKVESGEIHRVEMSDKYLTGFGWTKAQMEEYAKAGSARRRSPRRFRRPIEPFGSTIRTSSGSWIRRASNTTASSRRTSPG